MNWKFPFFILYYFPFLIVYNARVMQKFRWSKKLDLKEKQSLYFFMLNGSNDVFVYKYRLLTRGIMLKKQTGK